MSRHCKICAFDPSYRLAIEKLLDDGTVPIGGLSRSLRVSRVCIWRHLRKHRFYPPHWDRTVLLLVLRRAKQTRTRRMDIFASTDWEGWKEYTEAKDRAEQEGYDIGFSLTLI